ncbi:MAG: hypothetical protein ACRDZ0_15860 [Acidimicrobiales bacterium]
MVFTVVTVAFAGPAWAGSPHFVDNTVTVTKSGNTLVVDGKEAGLGDEDQVHVVVTATASGINPGNNKPQAANKETFSAEGNFPVHNGKANFHLDVIATFQPECSPPMTVLWTDITVADETNGISLFFADP